MSTLLYYKIKVIFIVTVTTADIKSIFILSETLIIWIYNDKDNYATVGQAFSFNQPGTIKF